MGILSDLLSGVSSTNGTAATSSSSSKSSSSSTTTINDLDYTLVSSPNETTLATYLSTSSFSYLANYTSHIISEAQSNKVCPLCLIAVSAVNTNCGAFDRWTINNDPGLVQKSDVTYSKSKPTYSNGNAGITALAQEMKSFSQETDGKWLSYLAKKYVTKAVTGGSDNLVTATSHDIQNQTGVTISDDSTKIAECQQKWLTLVDNYLTTLYSNVLSATPGWTTKTVSTNGSSSSSSKTSSTNKPAAAYGSNATGVTTRTGSHHEVGEKHTDVILIKNPENKTYAEPVYPDLLTVADTVPEWVSTSSTIPTTLNTTLFGLEDGTTTTSSNSVNKTDSVTSSTTLSSSTLSTTSSTSSTLSASSLFDDWKSVTGKALASISGTQTDAVTRQIVYDPSKYRNSFKAPTKGKPANNNDAFPVDLKIEELELHYPHEYIHQIECCPQAETVGKALLELASAAEKRTVKLENNMATIMRYLFALAGRMHINCVYYGGQTA